MIPVKLTLEGFLSYREPVELDFTGFDLACISGPNGAGKSSLLDAITWALFGQARRRDEALINTACDAAEVVYIFDYEGNRYRVQRANPRGKTSALEFHIQTPDGGWKPLTERTLRDTQARIEETLRLDYDTFVNASFFLQGKADQFTQQRPGDRKRILAGILGLDIWETYRRETVERRKKVEGEVAVVDGRLAEIDAELAEEDARRELLEQLETELARLSEIRTIQEANLENVRSLAARLDEQAKYVQSLDAQVAEAQQSLAETERRLEQRQVERDEFSAVMARAEAIEAAHLAWEAAQAEMERWEAVAAQFREQEKRRQTPLLEIQAARAALEQEQKSLEQQRDQITTARAEQERLNTEKQQVETAIVQLEGKLAQRAEAEENLEQARQEHLTARAENPVLRGQMNELKDRIDQLKEVEGAACPLCGRPLAEHDRQELVTELEAEGKEMGDRYRANQALLEQAEATVQQLSTQVAAFQEVDQENRQQQRRLDQLEAHQRALAETVAAWEAGGSERLAAVEAALEAQTFALEARQALAEVDAQLMEIGYDAAAHDEVRQRVIAGRSTADELRVLERAQAALAPLQREIEELETQLAAQKDTLNQRQETYQQASESLVEAQAQAPDVHQAERELLEVQERENRLRMQFGAAQQRVLVLDDQKERRAGLVAQREALTRQIGRYKQLERAFGKDGVPALLIEQALPEIEARANEILDRLSGGAMNVRFVTQAEYKDHRRDDLRETLDIQISDNAGVRDYEMYSGGEAFRVNFAIRLALSEVLAQRAGARLQTLVIDEGFGSQDALGRQRLVEAINMIRDDFATILVITHIDELKDVFPARIEVSKTPTGSRITLN
ncbi:MAG: AAA family ATPase [Anaerolineales bacterium]